MRKQLYPICFLLLLAILSHADTNGLQATLTAPKLISPIDKTPVSIHPTLVWETVSMATKYHVVVTDSITMEVVYDTIIQDSSRHTVRKPLLYKRLYFWKVRAMQDMLASPFSSSALLTINAPAPERPIVRRTQSLATSMSVTFKSPSTDVTFYVVNWNNTYLFPNNINVDTILSTGQYVTSTFNKIVLAKNGVYYYRIKAVNDQGSSPYLTDSIIHTPEPAPGQVIMKYPLMGDTGVSISPTMRWRYTANTLTFEVHIRAALDSADYHVYKGLKDSVFKVPAGVLKSRTKYNWNIVALNATWANGSVLSDFYTTYQPAPATPFTLTKKDTVFASSSQVVLTWSPVPAATSYCVEVSKDSTFTSGVRQICNITGTTVNVPVLSLLRLEDFAIKYFWRIAAINPAGQGQWTPVSTFYTDPTITSTEDLYFEENTGKLVPNPFQEHIQFLTKQQVLSLRLLDIQGQVLLASGTGTLHTAALPSGSYIVEVIMASGAYQTYGVVKK